MDDLDRCSVTLRVFLRGRRWEGQIQRAVILRVILFSKEPLAKERRQLIR